MSNTALNQVWKLDLPKSSHKFVLVYLADRLNDDSGVAFPSVGAISEETGLNKKTVTAAIEWLRQHGFLVDSGERVGKTKQVIVYRVETDPKTEQVQKRNSTVFSRKTPVFTPKDTQKRTTEPKGNPKSNPKYREPSHYAADDFQPDPVMQRQIAHRAPGKDLETELIRFRAHRFKNPIQDERDAQGRWVKWWLGNVSRGTKLGVAEQHRELIGAFNE